MSEIKVAVVSAEERAERAVTTGTKAWELFAEDPSVVAARVNGELADLAYELADGDVVEARGHRLRGRPRHPAALHRARDGPGGPGALPRGEARHRPADRDGFYYDFDVAEPVHPEDLEKIESRMRKIVKEGQTFSRRAVSDDEARAELADEPYKLELIGLKGGCRGARPRARTSRSAAAS